MNTSLQPRRSSAGFTLMEVLLALAVFSVMPRIVKLLEKDE